jgi:hypothetical protein
MAIDSGFDVLMIYTVSLQNCKPLATGALLHRALRETTSLFSRGAVLDFFYSTSISGDIAKLRAAPRPKVTPTGASAGSSR